MIAAVILLLATLGLLISAYFAAVAYEWMRPDPAWIPSFCRLDERTCASIVNTGPGRLFGPPNAVLGIGFYLALIAGAGSGLLWLDPWWLLYVAVSSGTVVLAMYLAYQLVWVLGVPCRLCFASHAINITVLVLLWLGR